MSDEYQIEIPASFMALYVLPGRQKPSLPRDELAARYELCEDMACMLLEHAQTLFSQGISGEEVLTRCHQGLLAESSVLSENEAVWVIHRLSELLGWTPRDLETK